MSILRIVFGKNYLRRTHTRGDGPLSEAKKRKASRRPPPHGGAVRRKNAFPNYSQNTAFTNSYAIKWGERGQNRIENGFFLLWTARYIFIFLPRTIFIVFLRNDFCCIFYRSFLHSALSFALGLEKNRPQVSRAALILCQTYYSFDRMP